MKKLFLAGLALIFIIACQQAPQRYFSESPEIETVKSGIKAYENQNWEVWKSNFADTAKIYPNSSKAITPDESIDGHKQMLSNFSSYGFSEKGGVSEMIIDKEGKTWVNYWNHWKGTLKANGKELHIPVHLTLQFIDGKIVNEYAYYNLAPYVVALQEIEADKMASEAEEMNQTEE
ncbi:nuclear transport factor 2 family protein [Snuella lapsa]|uniref:Nuclear transport factor 2 family protein n=1 Tax=Snuella lapsa TaxID=870481 RepID=A0ABP6XVH2_9FLAO